MIRQLAWTAAFVTFFVGLFGFIPGITTESGYLIGIFLASPQLNFLYIALGLCAAFVAVAPGRFTVHFFQLLGVLAAAAALLGIATGSVFGIAPVNTADSVVHALIAVGALFVGFGMKHDESIR